MSKRSELLEAMTGKKIERDPNQLYFCCPKCGHSRLTWVEEDVAVYTDVDCVYRSGEVDFGAEDHDDAADYSFECVHCKYRLMDDSGYSIAGTQELAEWLENNCYQEPR
ncbi:hypothetical protein ACFL2Q_06300 [Thermodesulfobacteriota bacterium]